MPGLPSLAFVGGSKETDGIFRVNYQVFEAVRELDFRARWIQCIDPSDAEGHFTAGDTVLGWRLPSRVLEQGVNRLWTFPRRLRAIQGDRVFLGDPTFLGFARGPNASRSVVAVHDLRPLSRYGDRVSTRWMFRHMLPRLRQVRRIRVYTQHLKDQLETWAGLREKTYLMYPHVAVSAGAGREHVALSLERISSHRVVTVLYIATDRPYKNLEFFFDLARGLEGSADPAFHFLLVSRLRPSTADRLERNPLRNLRVIPFAPDLEPVYRESDVLAFPSLYEGFGLPLLDAMARGIPPLANDQDPMREVVGNGGALLPTGEAASWIESLRSLGNPSQYRQATQRALDRAQDFSRERFLARVPGLFD